MEVFAINGDARSASRVEAALRAEGRDVKILSVPGQVENVRPVESYHYERVSVEEPLEVPTMNFGEERKETVGKHDGEEPLPVPTMNFEPEERA